MKLNVRARVQRANGFLLDVQLDCDTPVLGLVGPSGCGKSTLLDAIAGVGAGAPVVLDGVRLTDVPLHQRRIGYVTQDALLFPHLSVRGNITYSPTAGAIDEVVDALGIAPLLERMPRHLSGGERRRVSLARALVSQPRLLLLDEPFNGLDDTRRREALALVHDIHRTFQLPMVIVSHLIEEVVGLAGHVVRLDQGRLVAEGPSTSLLRAGETRVDNFLRGRVVGPGRVDVDGVALEAALPSDVTGTVRLACYADHIMLATQAPVGVSARNVITTRVASVTPVVDGVLVHLERPQLTALITEAAGAQLTLQPGSEIVAIIKAPAITVLGAG